MKRECKERDRESERARASERERNSVTGKRMCVKESNKFASGNFNNKML